MEENQTVTTAAVPNMAKLPNDEILFATLSYFNIAVLATIVSKPYSEFCKFHAKQGVTLVMLDLCLVVITSVALVIVPFFAFLIFFVGMIALFGLHIAGIVHAVQGKTYKLPVVYGLSEKIDITHFLALNKTQSVRTQTQETTSQQEEQVTESTRQDIAEPLTPQQPVQPVQPIQPTQPTQPTQPIGQDMVGKAVDELNEEKHNQ